MQTATRYTDQPGSTESMELTFIGTATPKPSNIWKNVNIPGYQTRFEIITPNSDGPHRAWKNFQHYKIVPNASAPGGFMGLPELTNGSYGTYYTFYGLAKEPYAGAGYYNSGGGYELPYGDPGALNAGLPRMYEVQADGGFVPPPPDLDVHKQRALNVMLPRIKAELSLVNSLIELKDFKRPLKSILEFIRTPRGWKNFVLAQKGMRTLRELDRSMASSYLEYKFNLAPLVSDICGFYLALSRAHSQMNDLLTRQGRVQRRHYAFNWREFDAYSSEEAYGGFLIPTSQLEPGCNHTLGREVWSDPTMFHAMIEYNYNYTRWQVQTAALGSILDGLGVNLNPAIVWNAIPFSFIVDWLIGVNRWLSQYTLYNMDPEINIHRFLWSVKRVRRIRVQKWAKNGWYPNLVVNRISLPEVTESSYRRTVELPSRSSVQLSGLSPQEFTLGAALVIGSGRRRHHRTR